MPYVLEWLYRLVQFEYSVRLMLSSTELSPHHASGVALYIRTAMCMLLSNKLVVRILTSVLFFFL